MTEKETEKNRNVFKRLNAHIATKRKTMERISHLTTKEMNKKITQTAT